MLAAVLAALLTAALPANSSDQYAVIPLITPGPAGSIAVPALLEAVHDGAGMRVGLNLVSDEALFVARAGELSERVQACAADIACIAQTLRDLAIRRAVLVTADFSTAPARVSLQIVDAESRTVTATSAGVVEEGHVVRALEHHAEALFDEAGYARAGRLEVDVTPGDAAIVVDRGFPPELGSSTVYTLPPGVHTVHVERKGHLARTVQVEVRSGRAIKLALILEESSPAKSSLWGSTWFWIAVGTIAAAAAGTAVTAAAVHGGESRCICVTRHGTTCTGC